jgi:hypothetical protein
MFFVFPNLQASGGGAYCSLFFGANFIAFYCSSYFAIVFDLVGDLVFCVLWMF